MSKPPTVLERIEKLEQDIKELKNRPQASPQEQELISLLIAKLNKQ